jgi:hypothetical protein
MVVVRTVVTTIVAVLVVAIATTTNVEVAMAIGGEQPLHSSHKPRANVRLHLAIGCVALLEMT